MKKIFSVLLAVMMVFSMSATAFAADFSDVNSDHAYYEAIETLSTLKIVNGYDDGRFDPDNKLTRAQACTILVKAFGGNPRNYPANIFTDVTNHWAKSFIHEAYYMGLVSGYGNGLFGPNDDITYDQVCQMILNALGYSTEGGWPTGVRTAANNAGLYENVIITDGSAPCSRGVICQMIYNAFDCMTINNSGLPTGETLLTSLGYKEIAPVYEIVDDVETGHLVTAYANENGRVYPTSLRVSTTYEDIEFADKVVVIGNKTYNIDYNNTLVIVDGKVIETNRTAALTDSEVVDAIIYKNHIVSLIGTTIEEYNPVNGKELSEDVIKDLGEEYCEGISTVTKVGNEYKVSNDTIFGYVVDTYEKKNAQYVELSTGEVVSFKMNTTQTRSIINNFENNYVLFFLDYKGDVSAYKIFPSDSEI